MDDLEKVFEDLVSDGMKATLAYTRDLWIQKAQTRLKSSREDYIQNLSAVIMEDKTSGKITLTGKLPVMIEEGFPAFDMKDGFKKSPKIKKNEKGNWYLTIPYRHQTTKNGRTTLPSNVMKEAKGLKHKEALREALIRNLGYGPQTSHTGYRWKNAKYDSLTRVMKQYPTGVKRSQYLTFRRVSANSDPKAWHHRGYKGLKAIEGLEEKAEKFFYDYMEANL